jgi:hypothetical protein
VRAVQSACVGLLGVGLFVYYLGPSHDFNLPSIWWPALLLAMIFARSCVRASQPAFAARSAHLQCRVCCVASFAR